MTKTTKQSVPLKKLNAFRIAGGVINIPKDPIVRVVKMKLIVQVSRTNYVTVISNVVHMTHFWNNLYNVYSKQKE